MLKKSCKTDVVFYLLKSLLYWISPSISTTIGSDKKLTTFLMNCDFKLDAMNDSHLD